MQQKFEQLKKNFHEAMEQVKEITHLEEIQQTFLSRKGSLAELMKSLKEVAENERKEFGQIANRLKQEMEALFEETRKRIEDAERAKVLEKEWLDITLPGSWPKEGHLHPVSHAIAEITDIFARIGFTRVPTVDIDWDYYAFEALNMPKEHPARDNWETFFIDAPEGEKGKMVAVPHISNRQVRTMEQLPVPFRALYIGRAYRRQNDPSHLPIHTQFEVLMVDKGVSLAHLKGVIEFFVREYFGPDRLVRYRPHHFRFTEPSFEIDISCDVCKGTGKTSQGSCRLCKGGWLELAGAGMTHPSVLRAGGIDPETYSALAFAFGVERTFMMRGGMNVDDIRILYKNDLRFVNQF